MLKYTYNFYYIYLVKNLINGKCYVGFHAAKEEYDNYMGSGKLIKQAIKKYGINSFIKGILEYVNTENWREKEQYWIKEMKSFVDNNGYNLTLGGDGTLGCPSKPYIMTDKIREHLRNGQLGKKQSQEQKDKRNKKLRECKRTDASKELYRLSKTGDKNPMCTYVFSDEQREIFKQKALTQIKKICEYCGKELFARHYAQSHGEKCKLNPKNNLNS